MTDGSELATVCWFELYIQKEGASAFGCLGLGSTGCLHRKVGTKIRGLERSEQAESKLGRKERRGVAVRKD